MTKIIQKKPRKKYTRIAGSNPPGNPELKPRQSSIKTAQEFQEKIDAYFKDCQKKKIPYTVTGLALALDFLSRQAVIDYENEGKHHDIEAEEKKLIIATIKKAKMEIENFLEINLIKGKQVAGTIFNLKNNYKYVDRHDVEHSGNVILQISGITEF